MTYPLSISAANAFRQCSRLYYNRYVLGWKDLQEAPWLVYGKKIDSLLEVLDNGNIQLAIEAIPLHFSDPYERIDTEVILRLFNKQFGNQLLPPMKGLPEDKPANQYPFKIKFHGNEVTGFIDMDICGKLDKVTFVDGAPAVMEGKTTSDSISPVSDYWDKLKLDPQITCYCWALSKELGIEIGWVHYQVIRKPNSATHSLFTKDHIIGGKKVKYELMEYRDRVLRILTEPIDKPIIARKRIFIDQRRKELWLTEHAQVYLQIQQHRQKQTELEERQIDGSLAWPRNQLGCDMYGGCSFVDCCAGNETIESSGKFKMREPKVVEVEA